MIRARLIRGCAGGALPGRYSRRKRKCRQIAQMMQIYMWRFHRMPFFLREGGGLVHYGGLSLCFSLLV